jgi:subtilisin family serine protease
VIAVSAFADSDGQPGGDGGETCDYDADDSFWYASNDGRDVDIAAPGSCIVSLTPQGTLRRNSGTSLAAPHVAGAVARYKADRPNASARSVRDWLLSDKASQPQGSPFGFTGDDDGSPERVLWLRG